MTRRPKRLDLAALRDSVDEVITDAALIYLRDGRLVVDDLAPRIWPHGEFPQLIEAVEAVLTAGGAWGCESLDDIPGLASRVAIEFKWRYERLS